MISTSSNKKTDNPDIIQIPTTLSIDSSSKQASHWPIRKLHQGHSTHSSIRHQQRLITPIS